MEYVRRYRDSGLDRLAYTVRLDDRDIAVLVQSLGHLRAVKADYFDRVYRGWVGVDQEVLEALSVRIHALAGSQQAEVTFTKSDMIVLLRCTCELADGLAPPDWEF